MYEDFISLRVFISLRERECMRENKQGEGQGETDSSLSKQPDMGLDPRTSRILT